MKTVFATKSDFESFLAQHGFTIEDGKYYFTADTNHNSYLSFEHFGDGTAGGLKFTDSAGTKVDIYYTAATMEILVFDYYELKDGGFAFRYIGQTASGSTLINTSLQWAAVAKDDGSGFVYLMGFGNYVSTFLYDDGDGIVCRNVPLNTNIITDTSNMVIMSKIYDNLSAFIPAKAVNLIATQSMAAYNLYTFMVGSKKYLGVMGYTTGAVKGGVIAFEVN